MYFVKKKTKTNNLEIVIVFIDLLLIITKSIGNKVFHLTSSSTRLNKVIQLTTYNYKEWEGHQISYA